MSYTEGIYTVPNPINEPVQALAPGDIERAELQQELERRCTEKVEIPCVVGGERIYTGHTMELTMPSERGHVLAVAHLATPEVVGKSIENSLEAQKEWAALPWSERAAVFLKAADLLAGPWRKKLNATTMLGQGKTCHQAEIDASCELIDFWRFNARFAQNIYAEQPGSNAGMWNRLDHRPLEGFVFAITPFNFTSIALNLPTAPALMGNVCLWKPARTQIYSAWEGMLLLEEAGLPPGVVNLIPGRGASVGDIVMPHPDLAGLHFTGSTPTFQHLWRQVADNLGSYKSYPRLVGETGGKDFIVAHPSADLHSLAVAILRGGFEYQGQKCSAASRIYIPASLWKDLKDLLVSNIEKIRMGDVRDFSNFMTAVIDENAFNNHTSYLELANKTAKVLTGGSSDSSEGWYVQPTLVQVEDPHHRLMEEEIFGPIVTLYVYEDSKWDEILEVVDKTSPYALTGAVFSQDRYAIQTALSKLRNAAGNFYINDKPTGAVVGQQPFGGARGSGTNDKAGSALNLQRWLSPRTIKETFNPPKDWGYSFLG
jgi:1-pyrroline-5-carboxylate dehydrogenase